MRGGGTSQAGQAIGPGVIVDTSKYLNRVLELNVEERWARVEPGIVLDELNAQLKVTRVAIRPDISTASRATVGGMMANNSSGARSVLYGKTIDHVLEQEVVLSDGSVAHFRALSRDELEAKCAGEGLEGECYRVVRRLAQEHADEIDRRFPKVLRRVGGYNLDEFVRPDRPFNLAKLMVGSEGTLGVVLEAKINLVPLPAAKAVLAIQFADLLEALEATPLILRHRPSADRGDGQVHPRSHPAERAARCAAQQLHRRRAGRVAVRRGVRRSAGGAAAAASGRRAGTAGARPRLSLPLRARFAGTGANLEPARSGARPFDGDERRSQVALLRRGHRGRAREAARLHRRSFSSSSSAMARRRACMRTHRSAAFTYVRS